MDLNILDIQSNSIGGYFSSEQIDLLSIIQCNSVEELIAFTKECEQINQIKNINENIIGMDLESAKRFVFKAYQDTMVYHNESKENSRKRRLDYLGITPEQMEDIIINRVPGSERLLELNHHFVSEERDQIKSDDLYDEMTILNENLSKFNLMLVGSGKIYNVVNKYYKEKRFDFYHAKRDLAFAYRNGKQVRYHSLLVKDDASNLFEGKSKDEIFQIMESYVKESINFINDYNASHKVIINGKEEPVINAVDLFNEIVSFERDENGQYYNLWERKYGISMHELMSVFEYARVNKPDGISYLYNEPFLEDDDRRRKVFETLEEIDKLSPGLIDTLGSQMHITIGEDYSKIERCFNYLKTLQDRTDKKIQITEFDMSLGSKEISRVFGENSNVSLEQVYDIKKERISNISKIINDSGVILSGVSYWSLTDGIDCNLERVRTNALENNQISDLSQIPTACGGLIPTHKKLLSKNYESEKSADSIKK